MAEPDANSPGRGKRPSPRGGAPSRGKPRSDKSRGGPGAGGRKRDERTSDRRGGRPGGPGQPRTRGSQTSGTARTGDGESAAKPRPPIDLDVTGTELERPVLAELRTLPETLAKRVAQHLVMVGRLVEDDPEAALAHAQAARDLAPRVAILRETLGFAAYAAGDFNRALPELRAARRISGNDDLLPLIADAERGLGRPDRALEVVASAPQRLPADTAVELLIVAAGARRDLGDPEAAVLTLQRKELNAETGPAWLPRLRYAYADALRAAGRIDESRKWFELAQEADLEGELDWPDEDPEGDLP